MKMCAQQQKFRHKLTRGFTLGFTLVELMITLAIIGITAIVVLPQMGQMTQSNKMTDFINLLSRDIAYARSEAITRGAPVDIVSHNGTNWTQGWFIQVNGGPVLRRYGVAGTQIIKGLAFTEVASGGTAGQMQFTPSGAVDNAATISLCDNANANTKLYGKQINLLPTGRIQIATKTDSAGAQICP